MVTSPTPKPTANSLAPFLANENDALLNANLNLQGLRRGKVRDVYCLANLTDTHKGSKRLLIVATDRLSAFDVVMPTPIPGKGRLLTEVSNYWFAMIHARGICQHHLISNNAADIPESAFQGSPTFPTFPSLPNEPITLNEPITPRFMLDGRIMIARGAKVIPIECVARGYLEGSGWKEYQATGSVCGVPLPGGLRQCDRLPTPIFTPATKEEKGKHDENISFDRACQLVGGPLMEQLRALTLSIYTMAAEHALDHGIIIADTKFEFGIPLESEEGIADTEPMLIDEVLTPDSSRFWPANSYQPGRAQPSYDKQYVREYLEALVARGEWNKKAPGPNLPPDVVTLTKAKYKEARDRLLN